MGSATREALAASRTALAELGGKADLSTAEDLFAAGRVIGASAALIGAISDPSADASGKTALVDRVFADRLSAPAVQLLTGIAEARWSHQRDVYEAIEELGIRAAAMSASGGVSITAELFVFSRAVTSEAELELALGSKLGSGEAKAALVQKLLARKASDQTVAIVRQLVLQPRGRSLRAGLRHAISVVADQAGLTIATVRCASEPTPDQLQRVAASLSDKYGTSVTINLEVDPALIGGLRIQIGDDVIDGSIAARMNDVRLRLAG